MRKTDPRVIRTRHMLRDALLALIGEKAYDSINIQEITDRAGLRRATFYLHYRDKEELLFDALREFYVVLEQEFEKLPFVALTMEAERAVQLAIFEHASQHAALYKAIFAGQGAATIIGFVRDYLVTNYREMCAVDTRFVGAAVPLEIIGTYTATLKINLVFWWLENDMPYSTAEMADMCARLTLDGLNGVLTTLPEPSLNKTPSPA